MPGYEKIGTTVIGSATTSNSNSITVTLTEDAPATEPNHKRGIVFYVVTHDLAANAPITFGVEPDDTARRAIISDHWGDYQNPYYLKRNGSFSPFAGYGHAFYSSNTWKQYGANIYMLRTVGAYQLYNPLYAGDQISFYFPQPTTILRMGINLHTYTDGPPQYDVFSRASPSSSSFSRSNVGAGMTSTVLGTGTFASFRMCQMFGGHIITDNTSDTFTVKTPGLDVNFGQQYSINMDGIHVGYGFQQTDDTLTGMVPLTATLNVPGASGLVGGGMFYGGDYWVGATFFNWISLLGNSQSQFYGENMANQPHHLCIKKFIG